MPFENLRTKTRIFETKYSATVALNKHLLYTKLDLSLSQPHTPL